MKQKRNNALLSLLLCLALLLSLAACGAPEQGAPAEQSLPKTLPENSAELRISLDGTVYTAQARMDRDSIFLRASALEKLLGVQPENTLTADGEAWGELTRTAQAAGIRDITPDPSLNAVYLWHPVPDNRIRIANDRLSIPDREPEESVSFVEFFTLLDQAVALAAPDSLEQWKNTLPQARICPDPILRLEAMSAVLYAAEAMGSAYTEFNSDWLILNDKMADGPWKELDSIRLRRDPFGIIPNDHPFTGGGFADAPYIRDWDFFGVAMRYGYGRLSLKDGNSLFDYDPESNSMRLGDTLTAGEAVTAVTRLLDSVEDPSDLVPVTDAAVTTCSDQVLNGEILQLMEQMPALPEGEPPCWHGAILSTDYDGKRLDPVRTEQDIKVLSQLGFDCVRVACPHTLLFSRDGSQASVSALQQLDQIVAAAGKYRIHLNFMLMTLPGRWVSNDPVTFTSQGEFDMFTNPQRQEEALQIWRSLSQRYAAVPASQLSFSPIWEAMNDSLSSGLPAPRIRQKDVAAFHLKVLDVIRQVSPDRLMIYEPTPGNDLQWDMPDLREGALTMERAGVSGTQLIANFCENPYVYAEMTATEGDNIDMNNHSMFKPPYPVTVYAAGQEITHSRPMVLTGDLPEGTRLDLYIGQVDQGGKLVISADAESLYEETLSSRKYDRGYLLSRVYPYATSEKCICVTLPRDTETLKITMNGRLLWSGADLVLPEQYAQQRWWFPSDYDAFLENSENPYPQPELRATSTVQLSPNGGNPGPIRIHSDTLSYTSDEIWQQSNRHTVFNWGQALAEFAPHAVVRLERAAFSVGTQYDAALAYYSDFLDMCSHFGLGWFSNDFDFHEIISPSDSCQKYAGCRKVPCSEGYVMKEMLELYQAHLEPPISLDP